MRHLLTTFGPRLLLGLVLASPAVPDVIDFEAQTVATGGNLTGVPDSPFTVGIATFTGGELLRGEVGLNADPTGVYATEGIFGSGETNPLVITFAVPVNDFSVYVVNGDGSQSYTVSDNFGGSVATSLPSAGALGAATFSLPSDGVTTVDITSADTNAWNFAIDNVSFTADTVVPEPASVMLFGVSLLITLVLSRKRLKAALKLGR